MPIKVIDDESLWSWDSAINTLRAKLGNMKNGLTLHLRI